MERREFLNVAALATLCGACSPMLSFGSDTQDLPKNVVFRGSYANSKRAFETTGKGRVAFLGGSITEMEGYRPMVCEYLTKKFPKTEFDFVAAGISSTCSDVGAFRLETDVLQNEENKPVDLFFVEFAVNDNQDGMFELEHAIRGMEGVVRHIRTSCPNVDIIMTFFVNEAIMAQYRAGEVATSIRAHKQVAERYEISTIDLAKEIQEEIDSKAITWEEFGGVHPAPRGNRICADMIAAVLDQAWDAPTAKEYVPHTTPKPLDKFSYADARFRGFDAIETNVGAIDDGTSPKEGGFRLYTPDWSKIPGGFRQTFADKPFLCAEKPGAEISFEFEGDALGLYILAGPDAGVVESQIDGVDVGKVNAYHSYSAGLHYPRAIMIADGLKSGKHKATIRLSADKDDRSAGTALRILQICVNK